MHLHIRRLLVMLCTLGLLLGSLSAALGRGTPAHATTPSGAAYAWGSNGSGQLGNGTTTDSNTPAMVNLPTGVTATAVAAGRYHSLAIGSDGKVYAWGYNGSGQMGNGTNTESHTPVMVSLPSDVTATAVAAGDDHSLAIGSDGKIYAWGANTNGQLGNGMSNGGPNPNPTPIAVTPPAGTVPLVLGTGSVAGHSLAIFGPASTLVASRTGASNGQQATASVGGAGPNQPGSYTATASGATGSVTVGEYAENPVSSSAPPGGGNYFDVKVSSRYAFSSVRIVDCHLGAGNTLYWYDGSTWRVTTPQSANMPSSGCITLTVSRTSSPNLTQLTGTPFASGAGKPTIAHVSRLRVSHHAGTAVVQWQLVQRSGLRGFNLYSGTLRLNHSLIAVHAGSTYRFAVHASGGEPIVLRGILTDGREVTLGHS